MKLYYSKGACSLVSRILLNELNISFNDESVDLKTKKTQSGADFLSINPKGAVPCIQLDNGDVITENQVIAQYLCDTTKEQSLLAPVGDLKRYRTLEWLNYISTEIHKTFGVFFNPTISDEVKDQSFKPIIISKFTYMDKHLKNKQYIMGNQFTPPDAYLFVMLMWSKFLKFDLSHLHDLLAFDERMKNHPSVMKSLQQEHLG